MISVGPSNSATCSTAPTTWKSPAEERNLSVLIVDDDAAVCRILMRILSDANYKVYTTQSVQDAEDIIKERPFDAYVFDYRLVDGTGLDIAEHLRSTGSEAPVILISGCESDDLAAMAKPLGISQIVEKPFSPRTICTAIEKSIKTVPPPRHSPVIPVSSPTDCPVRKDRPSLNIIAGAIIVLTLLSTLALYLLIRNS